MRSIVCSASALIVVSSAFATDLSARKISDEEWHADINEYVQLVKDTHIDMFHAVSEQDFQHAVDTLLNAVPEMSDENIAMEMVALAALIGDGHTWTGFGETIVPAYIPLAVYEFEDGVFVTWAPLPYQDHVGKRLTRVADVPVDQLLLRAPRYASRDNEWGLRRSRAQWLVNESFLVHEGIVQKGEDFFVTLLASDGKEEHVTLKTIPRQEYVEGLENTPAIPDSELPLYRQRGSEFYWMSYLAKEMTLFVKFNVVRDADEGPRLGEFTNDVLDLVDSEKVKKLIIDVRHNGGGNGDLTRRLVRKISTNEHINRPGKLFVITGRQTFSAALMFTARMERRTEALFAGEPGAGKPNSYGEFNAFTLSNSQMYGSISSRWHEEGEPDDTRKYIPVDIPAPLTSGDFFSQHDPVLDTILAY